MHLTQVPTTKPLALTRYIDDIFLIWTGTEPQLTTFLNDLNSFHPSLRFTHEASTTSTNFLDLTIFKGTNFAFTNVLDTKTFQKPLNLYQYLHFSSAHPSNVYKSIIRGECIRYVRTNIFIDKMFATVKYHNRHKYLQKHTPHPITCSPPLFKCLPPPQYKLLKQIILQEYSQLKFVSPRFISLRHPTLQNTLVRAQLTPTDEQLIDITLTLNTSPTTHVESATLPNLQLNGPKITSCRYSHCVTCRYHLLCTSTFQSTNPRNQII